MKTSSRILVCLMAFMLLFTSLNVIFAEERERGAAHHLTNDLTGDGGYGGNDIINTASALVSIVAPEAQAAYLQTVLLSQTTSNDNQAGYFNPSNNVNNDTYGDYGGFDRFGHQDGSDGLLHVSPTGDISYTDGSVACTFWGDGTFFDTNSNYDSGKEQAFSQAFRDAVKDGTITNAEQAEAWCQENSDGKIHYYEGEIYKEGGDNVVDFQGKEGFVVLIGIMEPGNTMSESLNASPREILAGMLALALTGQLNIIDPKDAAAIIYLLYDLFQNKKDLTTKFGGEDEEEKGPENKGQAWSTLTDRMTDTYYNYDADGSYSISNPEYDVEKAIPTSEYLNFSGSANDQLFNIGVRTWTYNNGVSDVELYQQATWYNLEEVTHTGTRAKKDEDGNVVKDEDGKTVYETYTYTRTEYVNKGTLTSEEPVINRSFVRSSVVNFYDVPITNYYGAQSLTVSGAPVSSTMGLTPGPEPAGYTINPGKPKPSPDLSMITFTIYTDHDTQANAQAIANAKSAEAYAREASIQAACDGTAPSPASKSYSHRGLSVSTYSAPSGSPGLVKTSGSDSNRLIPEDSHNGLWETSGSVSYSGYAPQGASGNNVFVHTPVVAQNIKLIVSKFVNQLVSSKKQAETDEFKYLQLDEGFEIRIPDNGKHIDQKGYSVGGATQLYNTNGNKTAPKKVTSWGAIKDIRLPFDAYISSDDGTAKYLLPRMTWLSKFVDDNSLIGKIDYKKSRKDTGYKFTIPVWVEEKLYKEADETKLDDANLEHGIQIRIIAENAKANDPSYSTMEKEANLDDTHYVAFKTLACEIIGKIYDLRVNESTDVDWRTKVQSGINANYKGGVRSNEFPFGRTTISSPLVRSQNINSAYHYATKLGYTFVFNFKTKGRKSNNISIKVADNGFYFVPKSGGTATKVDLYYKNNNGTYIKIANNNNNKTLGITLTNTWMGVDPVELTNSTRIYPLETFTPEPINKTKIGKYNYGLKVNVGDLAKMKLPHSLRLVYDNMNEYQTDNGGRGLYKRTASQIVTDATNSKNYFVTKYGFDSAESTKDFVTGSVGHWYAGYALPITTVAVTPGSNPNTNPNSIKKGGYILVRFDVLSQHEQESNPDYLQYKGPEYLNPSKGGTEYILPEKETDNTKDWTKPEPGLEWPTNKPTPEKTKTITLPGTNGPISVTLPTDTVAVFETDYTSAATDLTSVMNN